MQPEKNLHAAVPPALLTRLEQTALREHVSVDELIADAIARQLQRRELDSVLAFGKSHAVARGLVSNDVAAAIETERQGQAKRGH